MSTPDISQVPDVPINLLQRYLLATGWKIRASKDIQSAHSSGKMLASRFGGAKGFDIYTLGTDKDALEVVLPRDSNVSEYRARISGALKTLAAVQEIDARELVADISSIGFDVVRSHIPTSHLVVEAIFLDSAVEYMKTLRSLLASAATTEIHPSPFYGRVRKEATAYSDRCLFGHTFRGSFGFTVQSPLSRPEQIPSLFEVEPEVPFERRVIQRLASTVNELCKAADSNSLGEVAGGRFAGLSANGFETFANLIETAGGHLTLSFTLSREWASPSELPRKSDFDMSFRHVEASREVASILRQRPVSQDADVRGKVVILRNETNPAQLMEDAESREIQVAWYSEDFGDIRVRVALSASDYLQALEAHGEGRVISVRGRLDKIGVRWFLRHPRDFTVGNP